MDDDNQKWPKLSLVASKTLPHAIRPDLISCCPTMDLVAFATVDQRVEIYRYSGQRILGFHRKDSGSKVTSICWKYNGKPLLADAFGMTLTRE